MDWFPGSPYLLAGRRCPWPVHGVAPASGGARDSDGDRTVGIAADLRVRRVGGGLMQPCRGTVHMVGQLAA